MSKIDKLLKIADKIDEKGLPLEADAIWEVTQEIVKEAAKDMHPCGLKNSTVDDHKELFEGYKKAKDYYESEYRKAIRSRNEVESPNMGKLRDITSNYPHNCNAVRFHQMYFDDVVDCKPCSLDKDSEMAQLVKSMYDGGQLIEEMKRVAKVTRNGWVVLNYCTMTKLLYLDIVDLHDQHVIACALPILVLDMWEHAYIADFGTDKEAYVDWFIDRIDWRNPRKRLKNFMRIK